MLIEDINTKQQIDKIVLSLTKLEAAELKEALEVMLSDSPNRHEHISSSDYNKEITVIIVLE